MSCLNELFQFRLRLLQPVRHPHLAVHRRRGGEVLLRLLALARASVAPAETEVAVGDEGAHAEFLGYPQRFTVVTFCRLGVEPIARGDDLAQVAEGPSLVAALAALTG